MASRRDLKVSANKDAEAEEDDYMNMTFDDPAPASETSVRRSERLKRESKARGFVKSKATLAREEAEAREEALSKSLLDDPRAKTSKGLAMMAKMGFTGGGLGKEMEPGGGGTGRTEPIKVCVKENRGGIGLDSERKRQLQEAEAQAEDQAAKARKMDPLEYRERAAKERHEAKLESQFQAAQSVVEGLETDAASKPNRILKSIPLVYRGLVRGREEKQRQVHLRRELEQSIGRLPRCNEAELDDDDRMALGKERTSYVDVEGMDDEDEELEAFDALDAAQRLAQVVEYLRRVHHYCFWCKQTYRDEHMAGCPGPTEEDHD